MATRKKPRRRPSAVKPMHSELEGQTTDPALTKHPDPAFHAKFRDPDELCEEEPVMVGAEEYSEHRAQPAWFDSQAWRRSPKE
jgi:hypothetical protein